MRMNTTPQPGEHPSCRLFFRRIVVLAMICVWPALAGAEVAVGPRLGTTGIGADLTVALHNRVNLRLIGSAPESLTYRRTINDVNYEIELSTPTAGGVLDWHPAGGAFRLSLGAFWSGIEAQGSATPRRNVRIGDVEYPPWAVGTLEGKMVFPSQAGYAGIGFGNPMSGGRWTVSLDIGVLFGSAPTFRLDARDGLLSDHPAFREELKKEEQKIKDDFVDGWKVYPVLTIGLAYRF